MICSERFCNLVCELGLPAVGVRSRDDDSQGRGRNGERNFHKEKRSNETHQSTTDPEARLYKKDDGQPAKLCYIGHALTENRHGLGRLPAGISQATGTAERETVALIDARRRGRRRIANVFSYFSEVLIEVNWVFRVVPKPFTTAIIASAMPAAIKPYSIAVAPDSSAKNLFMLYFNTLVSQG